MPRHSLILTAGCALILSACGGGGGNAGTTNNGTGTTPPPAVQTSQLTTITPANAANAAGNGYAGSALVSQSSSSVTGLLTGVSIAPAAGSSTSAVAPVLALVKQAYAQGAPSLLAGVTESAACSGGGTITVDANLRNAQAISNGDTMAITAKNCVQGGNVLNGGFTVTLSNVSGDVINSTTGSVTLDTRFSNFSVGSSVGGASSDTSTLSGDMKIALSASNAASLSLSISGTSLQANEQRTGAPAVTRTLTNFAVTGTVQGSTVSSAASFTIAGNSSALGQFSFTVKNLKPFVTPGSSTPVSGSLVVNGASSSVTVTVLDANNVKLEYSAKGDGVITDTRTLSWHDFLAAN